MNVTKILIRNNEKIRKKSKKNWGNIFVQFSSSYLRNVNLPEIFGKIWRKLGKSCEVSLEEIL